MTLPVLFFRKKNTLLLRCRFSEDRGRNGIRDKRDQQCVLSGTTETIKSIPVNGTETNIFLGRISPGQTPWDLLGISLFLTRTRTARSSDKNGQNRKRSTLAKNINHAKDAEHQLSFREDCFPNSTTTLREPPGSRTKNQDGSNVQQPVFRTRAS